MKGNRAPKLIVKYLFDYVTVLLFLPVWIPIIIFVAVLIKVYEPCFPVFFIQRRIGRHGIAFDMIKFRTMRPGTAGGTITTAVDNRITRLGRILRGLKIDELPELFNILLGDMSLVGPRPDVPGYWDRLEGEEKIILRLKPGITGPASLKYSHEEELLAKVDNPQWYNDNIIFPDKVRINLDYYYNYTLWSDFVIILKTVLKR